MLHLRIRFERIDGNDRMIECDEIIIYDVRLEERRDIVRLSSLHSGHPSLEMLERYSQSVRQGIEKMRSYEYHHGNSMTIKPCRARVLNIERA